MQEFTALFGRHRELTWEMTKREVTERYAGQHIGNYWAIAHPVILTAVYIFLFGFVFRARVGTGESGSADYIVYLLSGLIPWLAFQESMTKGATSIVSNSSIVKQVVFPLHILPLKGVLSAALTQAIMIVLLVGYLVFVRGNAPWTLAAIPILLVVQIAAMTGVSYILAAAGAFIRDTKDIVQISSFVGTYLAPIAFLPEWVPERVRPLLWLNPFSWMVYAWQDACFYGRVEHTAAWIIFPVGAAATLVGGFLFFRKLRPYFGNVL